MKTLLGVLLIGLLLYGLFILARIIADMMMKFVLPMVLCAGLFIIYQADLLPINTVAKIPSGNETVIEPNTRGSTPSIPPQLKAGMSEEEIKDILAKYDMVLVPKENRQTESSRHFTNSKPLKTSEIQ